MSDSENERAPLEHRLPTNSERDVARQLSEVLAVAPDHANVTLTAAVFSAQSASVQPGPALTSLLLSILEPIANGDTVQVSRIPSRLSSSHAAELLGISRKKLIDLIKQGELNSSKVNGQVRLNAEEVFTCKRLRDIERAEALDALATHDAEFL